MKSGKLFVISAPSGAGKTTLTNYIIKKIAPEYNLSKIITYTSRKPRPDEKNGVDYHFISPQDFLAKKQDGFFLETNVYCENFYGSPKSILVDLKKDKSFIIVIDPSSGENFTKLIKNPVLIWLTLPNPSILTQRLTNRPGVTPKESTERLKLAKQELQAEIVDPKYQYHVVNDNIEQAAEEIITIIKKELEK